MVGKMGPVSTGKSTVQSRESSGSTGKRGPQVHRADVKEEILATARTVFSEKGFQRATIRTIAQAAEVDPKLIHYYFGSKSDLFTRCILDACEDRDVLSQLYGVLITQDLNGASYVRFILEAIETSDFGPAVLSLMRGFGEHQESRELFQKFISEQVIAELRKHTDDPLLEQKMALIGSQMYGLVSARYFIKHPMFAGKEIDELAEMIGPVVDYYRTM